MSKRQAAYLDASPTPPAKKSAVQPATARESDVVYVVVSNTEFHSTFGGSLFLGPRGLLEIDKLHCPEWLDDTFDASEIHAEDTDNEPMYEILELIKNGHARVVTNLKHMHVSTNASRAVFKHEDESDKDE